jgi:hypothetical protein
MLYLAQVQRKSGLLGKKTELKLLAQLNPGMVWNALNFPAIVPTDKANTYTPGSLVIAEFQNDREEIVDVRDATQLVVNALENMTLLQRKLREQEQEIESWKQSLVYQAQVLNQRKLEIEKHLEELCQQDIEDVLFDLRQVYFQYFHVSGASKQMILYEEELHHGQQEFETLVSNAPQQSSYPSRFEKISKALVEYPSV